GLAGLMLRDADDTGTGHHVREENGQAVLASAGGGVDGLGGAGGEGPFGAGVGDGPIPYS
ncbi:hypothetical protein ACM01_46880, partial [Streptomyces viridochromogenes]